MACYNGECCVYDSLGNPTMYRCHSLEWTRARKLAGFDANTFEYNASGIRFKKNNTVYTLDGDRILKETDGTKTLTYYYANGNAPIGFNYNGTNYYFRKNIQGDVVAIYDKWGFAVAKYVYDAWGNHKIYDEYGAEVTSTNHIGYINPIRYRGYYFDVETNLYYLQTRYYDPETGRFLNSDAIEYLAPEQLGGLNLFAYCGNNPVVYTDPNGNSFLVTLAIMGIGALVGAVISATSSAITQYAFDGEVNVGEVIVAAAAGFVSGAVAASPLGLTGQIIANAVIGGASYIADSYVADSEMSIFGFIESVGFGALSGWIGGPGANQNMVLTEAIESTKKMVTREVRRTNQKYAQKVISQSIFRRNRLIKNTSAESIFRFFLGAQTANYGAQVVPF